MKLRHAAALALVGWYLMLPPTAKGKLNLRAPLSEWEMGIPYDQADQCLAAIREIANGPRPFVPVDADAKERQRLHELDQRIERIAHAQCIATDDPRLKGN